MKPPCVEVASSALGLIGGWISHAHRERNEDSFPISAGILLILFDDISLHAMEIRSAHSLQWLSVEAKRTPEPTGPPNSTSSQCVAATL